MTTLGEVIRHLRGQLNLNQKELADVLGIQRAYLSQIESGKIGLPNADLRRRIAAALHVRHIDLLVAAGELFPEEIPGGIPAVDIPNAEIHAKIDVANLTPERRWFLDETLAGWLEWDRRGGSEQVEDASYEVARSGVE